jgi:putative endonuclease
VTSAPLSHLGYSQVAERSRSNRFSKSISFKLKFIKNIIIFAEMIGYMYIVECCDGTYYTGSTIDLERRIEQHNAGEGANYTAKRLPVKLVYFEEFEHVALAFYREKQVQGWSKAKKEALIKANDKELHDLSECKNESHSMNKKIDSDL